MNPGKRKGVAGLWKCFIWSVSAEHSPSPLGAACPVPAGSGSTAALHGCQPGGPGTASLPKAPGSAAEPGGDPTGPGRRERRDRVLGIRPRDCTAGWGDVPRGRLPADWLFLSPVTWRHRVLLRTSQLVSDFHSTEIP